MNQNELMKLSDDELAAHASGVDDGAQIWKIYRSEFDRRHLILARATSRAQISAARWTMYSAIAVAGTVVLAALGVWCDFIGLTASN